MINDGKRELIVSLLLRGGVVFVFVFFFTLFVDKHVPARKAEEKRKKKKQTLNLFMTCFMKQTEIGIAKKRKIFCSLH